MTRFFRTDAYECHAEAIEPARRLRSQVQRQTDQAPVSSSRSDAELALLTLQLGARFAAIDANGTPIPLTQKKGKLMLAMLACAPNMKLSRDWLRRTLWHRSFTTHGFISLRQCLHNLRLALGLHGDNLCANRDFVWLECARIDWAESAQNPAEFLKHTPCIESPVEAWRDRQRRRIAAGTDDAAG